MTKQVLYHLNNNRTYHNYCFVGDDLTKDQIKSLLIKVKNELLTYNPDGCSIAVVCEEGGKIVQSASKLTQKDKCVIVDNMGFKIGKGV